MDRRNMQIIKKIKFEINVIIKIVDGIDYDFFSSDEKTKRAVCMTFINIGELVKNLTDDFREKHSHVRWRDIAGLRDIAAHRYQTLRTEDIWETIKQDIPILYEQISAIERI